MEAIFVEKMILSIMCESKNKSNCWNMMLLAGSKEAKTLHFYKNAGYNISDWRVIKCYSSTEKWILVKQRELQKLMQPTS